MNKILSIDIGFVKPGISILYFNILSKEVEKIEVYENIKFNNVTDSTKYLEYFFLKKIDTVVLEQQITPKNISLLQFIHGYCLAKKLKVIIKRPISYLRKRNSPSTRAIKKNFSVSFLNNTLNKNDLLINFKSKDSDVCDSVNLGLSYIFNFTKKNYQDIDIIINSLTLFSFDIKC